MSAGEGQPLLRRVNPLVRRLSLVWLNLKKPFLMRRASEVVLERVSGRPFLVLPSVLNPVIFRGGRFLAESLQSLPLEEESGKALDLGTGSGVGAVFAAARGFQVTALDLNPEAVRCARINALLNRMEERIEVLPGDLFDQVKGRRFQLILFNPPFFQGTPRDSGFDLAWRSSPELPRRFARQAGRHLAPGGCILLLLSTDGDQRVWLDPLLQAGFRITPAARRHLGSEIMTIFRLRLPSKQQ